MLAEYQAPVASQSSSRIAETPAITSVSRVATCQGNTALLPRGDRPVRGVVGDRQADRVGRQLVGVDVAEDELHVRHPALAADLARVQAAHDVVVGHPTGRNLHGGDAGPGTGQSRDGPQPAQGAVPERGQLTARSGGRHADGAPATPSQSRPGRGARPVAG